MEKNQKDPISNAKTVCQKEWREREDKKKKKLEEEFLVMLQVYFLQNNIRVFS